MPSTDPAIVRRRQVALAGHRGDVETVRAHTTDPDWRVRCSALRALGRCRNLTADDLALGLGDERPEVRTTAVELGATTNSPSLLPSLSDPDAGVVEVACWASGERTPPEPGAVARLIETAGSHPDPLCRESAVAALGAIGDDAGRAAVIAGLDDKPAVRRRAVVALAAFEGPDVDAALARARRDRDRQVRDAVEELLGPEGEISAGERSS
jgi:HEAT repeat protein